MKKITKKMRDINLLYFPRGGYSVPLVKKSVSITIINKIICIAVHLNRASECILASDFKSYDDVNPTLRPKSILARDKNRLLIGNIDLATYFLHLRVLWIPWLQRIDSSSACQAMQTRSYVLRSND